MCWNCRNNTGRPHVGGRRKGWKKALASHVPPQPKVFDPPTDEEINIAITKLARLSAYGRHLMELLRLGWRLEVDEDFGLRRTAKAHGTFPFILYFDCNEVKMLETLGLIEVENRDSSHVRFQPSMIGRAALQILTKLAPGNYAEHPGEVSVILYNEEAEGIAFYHAPFDGTTENCVAVGDKLVEEAISSHREAAFGTIVGTDAEGRIIQHVPVRRATKEYMESRGMTNRLYVKERPEVVAI